MLVKTYASAVQGVDAQSITIEVNAGGNVAAGKQFYYLVGLPDNAVKEGFQRIEAALRIVDLRCHFCRENAMMRSIKTNGTWMFNLFIRSIDKRIIRNLYFSEAFIPFVVIIEHPLDIVGVGRAKSDAEEKVKRLID